MEATDLRFFLSSALILFAASACAFGQDATSDSVPLALSESTEPASLDTQALEKGPQPDQAGTSGIASDPKQVSTETKDQGSPLAGQQPKRILGIMPNFRAVSAGTIPPPPTPKQAFVIATKNSFDYSSFIFVGVTSALAEWTGAHSQLGEGMAGYGRYYWRGYVDKTDGNYLVIFALPTVFHQDERYYAMGKGGLWKRAFYAASRIAVTPNYDGHNTLQCFRTARQGNRARNFVGILPKRDSDGRGAQLKVRIRDWARCADECVPRILAGYRCARTASPSVISSTASALVEG